MDNQDKIFEKIKNAAHKAEEKDFPGMDRIWQRVDAKLEQKELQTKSKTWKKMAVAASLLLIFSIGYQFFKTDSKIITPNETKANSVVVQEKQDTAIIEKPSENIRPDAATILKKQIEKQTPLVVAEKNNSEIKNIAEEVVMTETKDIMIRGAAEAQKSEAIALEEMSAKAKMTTTYNATNRIISGIITDESNAPIPGATILVKGTKNATSSNFNGEFRIQAEKGDILVFSFIGFDTSSAIVEKSDKMNMKLRNNSMALNEVVVVGYGTRKKKDLIGAVASVSRTDVKKAAEASAPLVVLNGKVTDTDYKSVKEAKRKIPYQLGDEELESLTVLKEPLYIINGVEYTEESLFGTHPTSPYAPLNKQNIETMEVFQDKEAVAKFGKKGSKGVVIITTKNRMPSQK